MQTYNDKFTIHTSEINCESKHDQSLVKWSLQRHFDKKVNIVFWKQLSREFNHCQDQNTPNIIDSV